MSNTIFMQKKFFNSINFIINFSSFYRSNTCQYIFKYLKPHFTALSNKFFISFDLQIYLIIYSELCKKVVHFSITKS